MALRIRYESSLYQKLSGYFYHCPVIYAAVPYYGVIPAMEKFICPRIAAVTKPKPTIIIYFILKNKWLVGFYLRL